MGTTNFDTVQADSGFIGNLVGNVTGNITGGSPTLASADGAITVTSGVVAITKGSAAALTIAAPSSGGIMIWVYCETTFAHVITCATDGFNSKGSSGTITFSDKGESVLLYSRNGHWWVLVNNGGVIA